MILSQAIAGQSGEIPHQEVIDTLARGLSGTFTGQRVLVLIPDHTRSLPLPFLFLSIVDILQDAHQLDFMVALGTHPPMAEDQLNALVGISSAERSGLFKRIGIFNHQWANPSELASLGMMEQDEIKTFAGTNWHPSLPDRVDIRINKAALAYDHILILGPVFPHEVAGFSGGAKYLFPGISGPAMINATHWLGALVGVVETIGVKDTPVRRMIHSAAQRLPTPVTVVTLVMDGHDLVGLFTGDMHTAWTTAADLSADYNIVWNERPWQRVLSCAPPMYDELWTAAKAMYKLEPAVAMGGEVVIFAPHLDEISKVHGTYINEIGYHILPYFLSNWDNYKHIPLGVLAHSTHLRGSGAMENGREKPNVRVTLASRIPAEVCNRLNLGYLDPAGVNLDEWKDREQDGILLVPRAGEKLFRVKSAVKTA